jgi:hypothetical protein
MTKLFLCIVILFSLVGCGEGTDGNIENKLSGSKFSLTVKKASKEQFVLALDIPKDREYSTISIFPSINGLEVSGNTLLNLQCDEANNYCRDINTISCSHESLPFSRNLVWKCEASSLVDIQDYAFGVTVDDIQSVYLKAQACEDNINTCDKSSSFIELEYGYVKDELFKVDKTEIQKEEEKDLLLDFENIIFLDEVNSKLDEDRAFNEFMKIVQLNEKGANISVQFPATPKDNETSLSLSLVSSSLNFIPLYEPKCIKENNFCGDIKDINCSLSFDDYKTEVTCRDNLGFTTLTMLPDSSGSSLKFYMNNNYHGINYVSQFGEDERNLIGLWPKTTSSKEAWEEYTYLQREEVREKREKTINVNQEYFCPSGTTFNSEKLLCIYTKFSKIQKEYNPSVVEIINEPIVNEELQENNISVAFEEGTNIVKIKPFVNKGSASNYGYITLNLVDREAKDVIKFIYSQHCKKDNNYCENLKTITCAKANLDGKTAISCGQEGYIDFKYSVLPKNIDLNELHIEAIVYAKKDSQYDEFKKYTSLNDLSLTWDKFIGGTFDSSFY